MELRNKKLFWNMMTKQASEALLSKTLKHNQVYAEYTLKSIFIEGLLKTVRNSVRYYWSSSKSLSCHGLVRRSTLLRTVQGETADRETGNSKIWQSSRQERCRNDSWSKAKNVTIAPSLTWNSRNSLPQNEFNCVHVAQSSIAGRHLSIIVKIIVASTNLRL